MTEPLTDKNENILKKWHVPLIMPENKLMDVNYSIAVHVWGKTTTHIYIFWLINHDWYLHWNFNSLISMQISYLYFNIIITLCIQFLSFMLIILFTSCAGKPWVIYIGFEISPLQCQCKCGTFISLLKKFAFNFFYGTIKIVNK